MRHVALVMFLSVLIFGTSAFFSSAQTGAIWKIEYFNNPYLIGPSAMVQHTEQVALNWGAAAPGTNISADDFSARISTDYHFAPGIYRFYILSDDRAHVYVDFQSIINNWDNNQVGVIRSHDLTLNGGVIHIQIDYREEEGNAYVFFGWENVADGIQGPDFEIPITGASQTWTAEFFNNTSLSGSPSVILDDLGPKHDWGFSTPIPGITPDNFSVRWTTSFAFDGNPHLITVTADDGVRVYIENVLYINRWGLATGDTYTATVTPVAGKRLIRVEFFEAGGIASIDFQLSRIASGSIVETGAYLVVATGRLNVRDMPTIYGSNVLTKIDFGEVYPIVGVNPARTWWQINANGIIGWVSAPYVTSYNTVSVPITDGITSTTLPLTNYLVVTIANVNIRTQPSIGGAKLGVIPIFTAAQIIGRNANSTWWYVEYAGIRGWISAWYAPIQADANILTIPIIG